MAVAGAIAGAVTGLVSPFTQVYTDTKAREAQLKMQEKDLQYQKEVTRQQIELVKKLAIGLGILLLIYIVLKD